MNYRDIWKPLSLSCLLLLVLTGSLYAQKPEPASEERMQDISFHNVFVKSALSVLAKNMKMEIVYDQSVKNEMVDVELQGVTVSKAMTTIFEKHDLRACLIEEKTILVFPDTEEKRKKYKDNKPWPEKREPEK